MALDLTKPVQTIDGRAVRIICTDVRGDSFPVLGLIKDYGDGEIVAQWEIEGRAVGEPKQGPGCLINVPEERFVILKKFDGYSHEASQDGMTLRDYFAGQVVSGLMASGVEEIFSGARDDKEALEKWRAEISDRWAHFSYSLADAMLREREKASS